ncbi:MAG: uracil phosphoribosyltransferase [Kiloniellales bacterium]|nr:uracil phosphoribosyltransferase [Kiloniellales bacterium]
MSESQDVIVVQHPLIRHKLTLMRQRETPSALFRQLLREISLLLAYEVLREMEMTTTKIATPLAEMEAPILKGRKLCFISILRAGNGLLEGLLDLVPSARVGHIGLYRDPKTLTPVEYYLKLPDKLDERLCIVVDPMLATGNSAAAALERIVERGARNVKFVCLLAAPEGVRTIREAHPEIPIYTAALDSHLNEKGYIVPGLGDAGDRIYGTK